MNFRLSPSADFQRLEDIPQQFRNELVTIEVLRKTPGVSFGRTSPLVRSFTKAFLKNEIRPRYLVKKGTSDMNTLATTWKEIDMVAYGPGDSSLDHTNREIISVEEFRKSQKVLSDALCQSFSNLRSTHG